MSDEVFEFDGVMVEIKTIENNNVIICKVKGNLETSNSQRFLDLLENKLIRNSYKKMTIDLKELMYISSTGIGAFTTLLISCKNKGTELVLCNMHPKVKSVFDILGFSSFFNME